MWTREELEAELLSAEIKLAWMRESGIEGWLNEVFYVNWLVDQLRGGPHLAIPEPLDPLWRGEGEERA